MHLARADGLRTFPADPLQLVAEAVALGIHPIIGPVERMTPREHARSKHGGGKARAFLVRPVDDDDGVFGLDVQIVEGADDLEPAQNTQNPVVFAARGLGVEV